MKSSLLLSRGSTPIRRHHVLRLTCSILVLAGMGFVASSILWPRRFVRGTASTPYQYLRVGNEADVVRTTRPGLVLEGGGTDIDESFRWMIGRSGGGDFLVLRTSGTDAYNDYILAMTADHALRAHSAATLIVRTREAASDPFVIRTIRDAEAIWIAGGDQARHVAFWRGTPVADAINESAGRGVPIGGTSSGLAVMGEYIYTSEADGREEPHLTSTQALRDPCHARLAIRRDFLHLPFLGGSILEPHFVQESRYGRMAVFLGRIAAQGWSREPRGLGIDRKTALLVEPDGSARVITHPDHPHGKVILFRMAAASQPRRVPLATEIEGLEFRRGGWIDLSSWTGTGGDAFRLWIEAGRLKVLRQKD
jgi:cyanophycinase